MRPGAVTAVALWLVVATFLFWNVEGGILKKLGILFGVLFVAAAIVAVSNRKR